MMDQKPKGIPEEVPAEATEEMKGAPPIGEKPVPEELRPVVDKSEPARPVKKRWAWYYWTS
jgi:hypothetical protein